MSEREKLVNEVALDLFRRQHPTPGPERETAWLMYGADYVSDVTETLAAIEAAGVRLVPVEPTQEMTGAVLEPTALRCEVIKTYRAMLAASPYAALKETGQ